MSEPVKVIAVLFIACGLSAGSLAVVNTVTKEPIRKWETAQREAALHEVFSGAEEFKELTPNKLWEARDKGQERGYVVLTAVQGYSGPITVLFGVAADGAMTGLKVLKHTETPGLGAKITAAAFRDQFKNKRLNQVQLRRDQPAQGEIDAVTGATISSRAVTGAIHAELDSLFREKGQERR
jgi:electron transport complex protein RnfG